MPDDPLVKVFPIGKSVTDTSIPYREHEISSKAKRTVDVGFALVKDPADETRSLKPETVTVGAAGVDGFDLEYNSTYRFIANAEMNIALANATGVVTPDADDALVPAGKQFIFSTGALWKRLEVFSTPGGKAQVLQIG